LKSLRAAGPQRPSRRFISTCTRPFSSAAGVKARAFPDDVLAAAAAGDITLTFTTELYRCSVIGPKL
jgi:hypothetical protein